MNVFLIRRSHTFDQEQRKKRKVHRKSSEISRLDQPSKGAQGYRVYHKINEENIMPHRRSGISDTTINMALEKQLPSTSAD